MKIGMMTTWGVSCGIYEYTRNLSHSLAWFVDVDSVKLFTNKLTSGYSNASGLIKIVEDSFGSPFFGSETAYINMEKILENVDDLDVFHVQYQVSLYRDDNMTNLIREIKNRGIKTVVTLHDSSRHPGFDVGMFDHIIIHKPDILKESHLIDKTIILPFPIPYTQPSVFSFGMGRNNYKLIQSVCDDLMINFDYHDAKEMGWAQEDQLFHDMYMADAIVLWYSDVATKGSSSAARMALASYRPVIVNDIPWFSDLPNYNRLYKVRSAEELENVLCSIFEHDRLHEASYDRVAGYILKVYRQ